MHAVLLAARAQTRIGLLESMTVVTDHERRFVDDAKARHLNASERSMVLAAFDRYLETIPAVEAFPPAGLLRRQGRGRQHRVRHRQRGTAGVQRAHRGVQPGARERHRAQHEAGQPPRRQSGRQRRADPRTLRARRPPHRREPARPPGPRRPVPRLDHHRRHRLRRRRALALRGSTWTGATSPSPTRWRRCSRTSAARPPRCTAPSDEDSDEQLVEFQTEEAILAAIGDREQEFVEDIVEFAMAYAETARRDHALFVDAFRAGEIAGLSAT